MKTVRYLPAARAALLKHRSEADRIRAKVREYAANPAAFPKVKRLKGSTAKRLRVGDFRVIFEETADEIVVTKVGPRGSIYQD